jgi:hypothetical protein
MKMRQYLLRYSQATCLRPRLQAVTRPLSKSISTVSIANAKRSTDTKDNSAKDREQTKTKEAKKTMAQLDEELRMKLEGRSGDGGAAGLELENGKPVAMKRGVRENMFRLI